jgi:4-methyl-5(b-hydroxyethyl)-thiazole monophosphate biosynthesis
MAPTVLTLLADGFEEIEATAPIDLLRRAKAEVTIASCSESLDVTGRSNITLHADALLSQVPDPLAFDLLVLPGGPAVFDLRTRCEIIDLIQSFARSDKPVGAICAAPLLLLDAGLLTSDSVCTAHGSTSNELANLQRKQAVIHKGKIITSRGAGTAVEFGLSLIYHLFGPNKENEIRSSIHADL